MEVEEAAAARQEGLLELYGSFREMFEFFCKNTTIHGTVRLVSSGGTRGKRALWTLLLLASLAMLYWQFALMFSQFWAYPVVLTMSMHSEPKMFPAVTVCNLDPYRFEPVREHLEQLDRMAEESLSFLYGSSFSLERWLRRKERSGNGNGNRNENGSSNGNGNGNGNGNRNGNGNGNRNENGNRIGNINGNINLNGNGNSNGNGNRNGNGNENGNGNGNGNENRNRNENENINENGNGNVSENRNGNRNVNVNGNGNGNINGNGNGNENGNGNINGNGNGNGNRNINRNINGNISRNRNGNGNRNINRNGNIDGNVGRNRNGNGSVNRNGNVNGNGNINGNSNGNGNVNRNVSSSRFQLSHNFSLVRVVEIRAGRKRSSVGFRLCNSTGGNCFYKSYSSGLDAILEWYRFHYMNIMAQVPLVTNTSQHQQHLQDMIYSCQYDGEPCRPSDFVHFHHPAFGSCYTFNSKGTDPFWTATKPGIPYGLSLLLRAQQRAQLPLLSPLAGLRVLIHRHNQSPFLEHEGFDIRPGIATAIAIRQDEVNRLGGNYGKCTTDGRDVAVELLYNSSYSLQACLHSCFQQLMLRRCGCGYYYYPLPAGARHCDYGRHPGWGHCFYQLYSRLRNHRLNCFEQCPKPCRESLYKVSAGTAKWPSTKSQDWVRQALRHQNGISSSSSRAIAKVSIFYQQLNSQAVHEAPLLSENVLLSRMGSQWSLWFGSSVLSVLEVLELLLDSLLLSLLLCCQRLRGARRGAPNPAPETPKSPETTTETTSETTTEIPKTPEIRLALESCREGAPGSGILGQDLGLGQDLELGLGQGQNLGQGLGLGQYLKLGLGHGLGKDLGQGLGQGQDLGQDLGQDFEQGLGQGQDLGQGLGQDLELGLGQGLGQGQDLGQDLELGLGQGQDLGQDLGQGLGLRQSLGQGQDLGLGWGQDLGLGKDLGQGLGQDLELGQGLGHGLGQNLGQGLGQGLGLGQSLGHGLEQDLEQGLGQGQDLGQGLGQNLGQGLGLGQSLGQEPRAEGVW